MARRFYSAILRHHLIEPRLHVFAEIASARSGVGAKDASLGERAADFRFDARNLEQTEEHVDDEIAVHDRRAHSRRRAARHLDAEVLARRFREQLEEDAIALVFLFVASSRGEDVTRRPLLSQNSFSLDGSTIAHASHALPSSQSSASSERDSSRGLEAPGLVAERLLDQIAERQGRVRHTKRPQIVADDELLDALLERIEHAPAEQAARVHATSESRKAGGGQSWRAG